MSYFNEAGKKYKPTTLWSMYSMLKKTIILKHNIDISKYCQMITFLSAKSDGYHSKKSEVLTKKQINEFLVNAPNIRYRGMKVSLEVRHSLKFYYKVCFDYKEFHYYLKAVLALGVFGACRGDEIVKLTTDNVTDDGFEIVVRIPDSKTKEPRMYPVNIRFVKYIREYISLRPPNITTNRFFIQYRNGKFVNQVMGKNSISIIPKEVATFLGLANPKDYTGHSVRRSSTTIAANAGAGIEMLKRLGGWKSSTVCEGYIQESLGYK